MIRVVPACIVAVFFAAPSIAQTPVESVKIKMDLTAVGNQESVAFWGNLPDDLEKAVIERVVDRIEDEGERIIVDIDEFAMADSLNAALGKDSIIKALVHFRNDQDNTKIKTYDLLITLSKAGNFVYQEDGAIVKTIPIEVAYKAMIDGFADAIVARIPE